MPRGVGGGLALRARCSHLASGARLRAAKGGVRERPFGTRISHCEPSEGTTWAPSASCVPSWLPRQRPSSPPKLSAPGRRRELPQPPHTRPSICELQVVLARRSPAQMGMGMRVWPGLPYLHLHGCVVLCLPVSSHPPASPFRARPPSWSPPPPPPPLPPLPIRRCRRRCSCTTMRSLPPSRPTQSPHPGEDHGSAAPSYHCRPRRRPRLAPRRVLAAS
mmetsp:Transcript_19461/g.58790  ORF Transcript_19461/g.58790 Transcript_19461/m.58790 type:complete len:219 (+) Transcript_19461:469-1125(+)